MLIFAGLGLIMSALNYPVVVFVIAYFLAPRFELSLGQSLAILRGDPLRLVHHPVALILLAMSIFALYWLNMRQEKNL